MFSGGREWSSNVRLYFFIVVVGCAKEREGDQAIPVMALELCAGKRSSTALRPRRDLLLSRCEHRPACSRVLGALRSSCRG